MATEQRYCNDCKAGSFQDPGCLLSNSYRTITPVQKVCKKSVKGGDKVEYEDTYARWGKLST
jgi:hypothetical protein